MLQRLDAAGLEHLDVVVVHRRRLGGHLLRRHRHAAGGRRGSDRPTPPAAWSGARAGAPPAGGAARRSSCRRGSTRTSAVTSSGRVLVHAHPLLTPLGHGHGRAAPGFGDHGELVHQPARAGQTETEPVVGAVPVGERLLDVRDAGAGVAGDHLDAAPRLARAARRPPHRSPANRTMLRATSETAVAMTVRSVPGEAEPGRRARERGLARRRRCRRRPGSGCAPRRRVWLPALHQRPAQPGAQLALQQVPGGVDLALPTPVAAGEGEQHRSAAAVGAARCAPAPAGTRPAAGHASGSAARPRHPPSSRAAEPATGVLPGRPREPAARHARGPRAGPAPAATAARSSAASSSLVGSGWRPEVDHPVLVAAVPVLLLPHRRDDVACRHDRVRLEHPGLDPVGGGQHPDQGLLHEVVGSGVVAYPRPDDPPDHRDEPGDVVAVVRAGRRVGGRSRAHAREGARASPTATPIGVPGDHCFAHAGRGRRVRMTGWSYAGEPAALGSAGVTLVEGSSFCVCDQSGDVREGTPHGVFFRDTRIVSRWQVTLDGEPVETAGRAEPGTVARHVRGTWYTTPRAGREHVAAPTRPVRRTGDA